MKCIINTILTTSLIVLAGIIMLPVQTTAHRAWVAGAVALAQNDTGAQAENPNQPRIMIPDPLFTFETVVDGTEVVHDFRVYNRGSGELTIDKIETG